MGRKGYSKKPKNPFAAISSTWREAVDGMNREEVQARITTTTIDHAKLMAAKKLDEDLIRAAKEHAECGKVYREGERDFRLKVEYLRRRLDDLGGSTGAVAKDEEKKAVADGVASEADIKNAAAKFNQKNHAQG